MTDDGVLFYAYVRWTMLNVSSFRQNCLD